MFKKILQLKLKYLAKLVLLKYKPEIVGITGSIGKTSAKEAIYAVLKKKFNVRQNIKNYNNEIGLPLTILGLDSPGRSLFGWIALFFKALYISLVRQSDYPRILILEMGVDRPGDMSYLKSIVKPNIGIVTLIGPSHLEFFGSIEKIQEEKGALIEAVPANGWAILNYDDEKTRKLIDKSKAKVMTYGFDARAKVRAAEVNFIFLPENSERNADGISFKLGYDGSYVPVLLPHVIGYNAIYAALAAAAAGIAYGMNLLEISEALRDYDPPRGRMNLIKGIKKTYIVDDTYNASPPSTAAALEILKIMATKDGNHKYAVLGDMLELGSYSVEGHKQTGRKVVEAGINYLFTVGERSRDIGHGAAEAGMDSDRIIHFDDNLTAGKFIQDRIKTGDIILVKGSQGMRMEKIVKEIMAEPMRAQELLVRMDESWAGKQ